MGLVQSIGRKIYNEFWRTIMLLLLTMIVMAFEYHWQSHVLAVIFVGMMAVIILSAVHIIYMFCIGVAVCFTKAGWKYGVPAKYVRYALGIKGTKSIRYWHLPFAGYYVEGTSNEN